MNATQSEVPHITKTARKVRRDSKLLGLPEDQRRLVAGWLEKEGAEACRRLIEAELGITVSQGVMYEALAYWREEERFNYFLGAARAQLDLEAECGEEGMSAEEMDEAVGRSCIARAFEIAEESGDFSLYRKLRYLMIAERNSKTQARNSEIRLTQRDRQIALETQKLALAVSRQSTDAAAAARDPLAEN